MAPRVSEMCQILGEVIYYEFEWFIDGAGQLIARETHNLEVVARWCAKALRTNRCLNSVT